MAEATATKSYLGDPSLLHWRQSYFEALVRSLACLEKTAGAPLPWPPKK